MIPPYLFICLALRYTHHIRHIPDSKCQKIRMFYKAFYPKFLTSDQCLVVSEEDINRILIHSKWFEFVILVNCTFDESFCGWSNILTSPNGQISWHRKRSGNQSQGTGPPQDHTGTQNILMTM